MIRFIHSAVFAAALTIVLFGSAFSHSFETDDLVADFVRRGDGSTDDGLRHRLSPEAKRRRDDSSGDRQDDREIEDNRRRSDRNRGRDDRGILTRDEDGRYDDRGRKRHR
ncbi:MAG: hypothetical protein MPW16_22095 (plasmid) [Candidatus Manganitrophus sp.]|nr:MAG: hypothetical protein MPW16_22095 [Candidatus Manganitrophus sp.]